MPELVPVAKKIATVAEYFGSAAFRDQIALALPRGMTADRMARIALTEMRRTPKLLECSIASLSGAVMQCAQLGLEPGPMGLAYLIPYKTVATFQLGYKGVLALTWRSDLISSVQAEVVYEGDHFEFAYGIPPKLEHVPAAERDPDAAPTHVYAAIGTTSGGWIFRVMSFEEIEKHRNLYSKAKGDSPWSTAWDEMACKTVLIRTCKRAPISAETHRAISLDDLATSGIPQRIEVDVTPPADDGDEKGAPEAADGAK